MKIWRRLLDLSLAAQLALSVVVLLGALTFQASRLDQPADLFFTRDQQGMRLLEMRRYGEAAERFQTPTWRGYALYLGARYGEAAEEFARSPHIEDLFNRGDALLRSFKYRAAIDSFALVMEQRPEWLAAQENLALARHILAYLEHTREQSDTGEESGIGADEIVYDNDSERGTDIEVTRESAIEALAAEKWMRTVNTDTADFLRSRFQLELSRQLVRKGGAL